MTPLRTVVAVEAARLTASWRLRGVLLLALLAPVAVCAVLQLQPGLPTDALYGRWVKETGLAVPLVLLTSVGVYAVPLLASLVGGDVLSSEDAHGTWPLLLARVRPARLVTAKVALALLATTVLVTALALGAVLSGVLLVGRQPLVGLAGQQVPFGRALALVALAWAGTLPTAWAFTALAVLLSAVTRSSLVGVVVPPVLGAALQLASQLATLGPVRPLLLAPGLQAWHGLLLEQVHAGPLLLSCAVAAGWSAVAGLLTARVLSRRDLAVP